MLERFLIYCAHGSLGEQYGSTRYYREHRRAAPEIRADSTMGAWPVLPFVPPTSADRLFVSLICSDNDFPAVRQRRFGRFAAGVLLCELS